MAYVNPYMQVMTQGGQLANQTFSNANNSFSIARSYLDSGASLAMKLDALLQEEEQRKLNNAINANKVLTDITNSIISNKLNEAKLNEDIHQNNIRNAFKADEINLAKENLSFNKDRFNKQYNLSKTRLKADIDYRNKRLALDRQKLLLDKQRLNNQSKLQRLNLVSTLLNYGEKITPKYDVSATGEVIPNLNYQNDVIDNAIALSNVIGEKDGLLMPLKKPNIQRSTTVKNINIDSYTPIPGAITPSLPNLNSASKNDIDKYNSQLKVARAIGLKAIPTKDTFDIKSLPPIEQGFLVSKIYENIDKVSRVKGLKNAVGNDKDKWLKDINKGFLNTVVQDNKAIEPIAKNPKALENFTKELVKSYYSGDNDIIKLVKSSPVLNALVTAEQLRKEAGNISVTNKGVVYKGKDPQFDSIIKSLNDNKEEYVQLLTNRGVLSTKIGNFTGDTDEIIRAIVSKAKQQAKNGKIPTTLTLIANLTPNTWINKDYSLWFNIVGNELKYTPKDLLDDKSDNELIADIASKLKKYETASKAGLSINPKTVNDILTKAIKRDEDLKNTLDDVREQFSVMYMSGDMPKYFAINGKTYDYNTVRDAFNAIELAMLGMYEE